MLLAWPVGIEIPQPYDGALELRRETRLDSMTVRVEPRDGGGQDGGAALAFRIKTVLGVSVRVELAEPGSIERSAGKAKRILDLRGVPA